MDSKKFDAIVMQIILNGKEESLILIYTTSFQQVLDIWREFPESQWEITRLIGRDLIEWQVLREVLIIFKKQLESLVERKSKEKP